MRIPRLSEEEAEVRKLTEYVKSDIDAGELIEEGEKLHETTRIAKKQEMKSHTSISLISFKNTPTVVLPLKHLGFYNSVMLRYL